MGLQDSLYTAVSGLNANVHKVSVAAANIANVNTPEYLPNEVLTSTVGVQQNGGYSASGVATVVRPAVESATAVQDMSQVNLVQEFTTMMLAERAYAAGASVIRTASDMMRTTLGEG